MGVSGSIVRFVLPQALTIANGKLRDILSREFGGYTMIPCVGAWAPPGSPAMVEQALMYEVLAKVDQASLIYQKNFDRARAVFAELYDTASDMKEQAVYFTVNTTANILTADECKASTLYKAKPPVPEVPVRGKAANTFPLTSAQAQALKEGSVLRYYGADNHGPYGPKLLSCVRVKSVDRHNRLMTVEYTAEDAFAVPEGPVFLGEGTYGLYYLTDLAAWRFVGQGESLAQKAARLLRVQALMEELDAISKPVDPTQPIR